MTRNATAVVRSLKGRRVGMAAGLVIKTTRADIVKALGLPAARVSKALQVLKRLKEATFVNGGWE